jgi:serine/threonine protein phosphatase 1
MLNARKDLNAQRNWLFNGGWTTVESFQANLLSDIPKKYFQFIEDMNGFLEVDEFILVHAGINFKSDNPFDDTHSMKWIRNWYSDINIDWLKKRIIIHGHTPIEKERTETEFQSMTKNHYLNLDTGCVYKGKRDGLGFLTCFNMTAKELIFQENVDW